MYANSKLLSLSKIIAILATSLIFIILFNLYDDPLHEHYHGENFHAIHTLLELFSIFVSFSICTYGYLAYNDTKSYTFLWVPAIFFAVGFFDLLHTFSYIGMPEFFTANSLEKTVWFWLFARIITGAALLFLLKKDDQALATLPRKWVSLGTAFFVLGITFFIFMFEPMLPTVADNSSPNLLKNSIEFLVIFLYVMIICVILNRYKRSHDSSELDLFMAFCLFIISEVIIMWYTSSTDINIIFAHIFKALGFVYIFKYYYFSKIELTFQIKSSMEKELRDTQGLLEAVFKHIPDSVSIFDLKGTILQVNPGFETTYGWSAFEVVGKNLNDLWPDCSNEIQGIITKASEGKHALSQSYVRRHKNGDLLTIQASIFPIKNDEDEITYIAFVSRDVTNQKKAEERAREAELELIETVHHQEGVIFKFKKVSGNYIYTICDGHLLQSLHLTSEMVVGNDLFSLFDEETAHYKSSFYEQAWLGEHVSFELTLNNKILYITLNPLKRNEQVREVVGSILDITELKKTEELLQKSEKLALVGELAAGLAHEIRNPLTTLKGFTQLIESNKHSNREYTSIMMSELNRLEMITNEFMVVAKPEAVKYQQQDLSKIIEQVILFFQPQSLLYNIQINLTVTTDQTTILCDANQIKQVFLNLLKNSFEAMPHGGVISISVLSIQDSWIFVRVQDNGVGIPKEIIPKLGEPFYSLKEKGTGLGLMVSFRIIEAHRGSIEFLSEENFGTLVDIKLPLAKIRMVSTSKEN